MTTPDPMPWSIDRGDLATRFGGSRWNLCPAGRAGLLPVRRPDRHATTAAGALLVFNGDRLCSAVAPRASVAGMYAASMIDGAAVQIESVIAPTEAGS
ncbi:MAG: hypothetical protein V9E98_15115 [Candidatus Nanopelagicales bacterium]